MTDNVLKATLVVAFSFLIGFFTWKGCRSNTKIIDLEGLKAEQASAVPVFDMSKTREQLLNAVKTRKAFPATYEDFTAAGSDIKVLLYKASLLDSSSEFGYAAMLYEKAAMQQKSSDSMYIKAGREFILAAASAQNETEQIFFGLRAQENLQKAKDLNPGSIEANTDLALCYLNNPGTASNPQQAMRPIKLLLEVVDKDPNNIDALYLLATQAERTGQNEKAIERYKKLISLQPQNPEYLLSISRLYAQQNKTAEAAEYQARYEELMKKKPKIKLK